MKRVVRRFRRAFEREDKVVVVALILFKAHLVNQKVVTSCLRSRCSRCCSPTRQTTRWRWP